METAMGYFRLTSLFALTLGASLVLGALPRDARADVCGNNTGCVVANDLKRNAVKARHRLDEAGTDFIAKRNVAKTIGLAPQIYASVVIDAPAKGTVIVNASITLEALKNPGPGTGPGVRDGRGTVLCALTAGGNVIATNNPNRFFGSVDWDDKIEFETMAITTGFRVTRKISSKIALSCQVISLSGQTAQPALLRVRSPSISAAYYSNL